MTTADVEIEVPARPEFVALVRHVVGATARLGGLSADCVDYAKIAVSEAATNAVTATERAESTAPVEVSVTLEPTGLTVSVGDRGKASAHQTGDEPSSLDFSFERGLSIPLIEGLVDHLEIHERDGGGSVVSIRVVDPELAPKEE